MTDKTLFQKIIDGEIPGTILYEDDLCVVLRDINPQAPTHLLVIPREPVAHLSEAKNEHKELLGHLILVAKEQAQTIAPDQCFRLVINNGPGSGETVPHLHIHLLSGRNFTWPPG